MTDDVVCQKLWTNPIRGREKVSEKVGLEMEMLVYDAATGLPLGLPGTALSSQDLLRRVHGAVRGSVLKEEEGTGVVLGVTVPEGGNYSIEPGGQVEFSSSPQANIDALVPEVVQALERLQTAAAGQVLFASHGTNPIAPVDFPLLLPKSRYLTLSRYFQSEPNGRGVHMSRYSCTVQPNIDVSGDADWHDAVNLAQVLTPFARFLFANSRYFLGRPSAFYSERQNIWEHMDSTRTGIPPGVPFAKDIASAYAAWALDARVFLIAGLPAEEQPLYGELTFRQWLENGYRGRKPHLSDWETHLGTLFPDLRLRGFLEIRMVDAQPFEHTLAPVAFWSKVLQVRSIRKAMWRFLLGVARTYVTCTNCLNFFSRDQACYLALLHENPHHGVFSDAAIHKQLLEIALEGAHLTKDHAAAQSLGAYQGFLNDKSSYWQAESAQDFVNKIATQVPAELLQAPLLAVGRRG